MSTRQFTDFVLWLPRTELSNDHAVFVSYNYLVLDITPFQPRCERNHRSRAPPCSLILYSNVPLPRERLSSRPKVHNLLKYVQAERAGEKFRGFYYHQGGGPFFAAISAIPLPR